ncbi:MAG: hypothetical protein AAB527_02745 [Patescibacteria group bacterium]
MNKQLELFQAEEGVFCLISDGIQERLARKALEVIEKRGAMQKEQLITGELNFAKFCVQKLRKLFCEHLLEKLGLDESIIHSLHDDEMIALEGKIEKTFKNRRFKLICIPIFGWLRLLFDFLSVWTFSGGYYPSRSPRLPDMPAESSLYFYRDGPGIAYLKYKKYYFWLKSICPRETDFKKELIKIMRDETYIPPFVLSYLKKS